MNNKQIYIENLKVRPVCHNPETPESDIQLDNRTQFLLFKNTSSLIIETNFLNERIESGNLRQRSFKVNVDAYDVIKEKTIVSKTVKVRIPHGTYRYLWRTTLPLSYDNLHPNGEQGINDVIRVTVNIDGCDEYFCGRQTILLYNLPYIKMLPTKWASPVEACFIPLRDESLDSYRNPNVDYDVEQDLCFTLKSNVRHHLGNLPEMELRVTDPEGNVVKRTVMPQKRNHSSDEEPTWSYRGCFSFSKENRGVYYAEILCMGHAFAGFLFNTSEEAEKGTLSPDELNHIPNYNYTNGPILYKRSHRPGEPTLDSLTGLADVKRKVMEYTNLARFNRLRAQAGLCKLDTPLHCMFLGSSGTGKTTVAKIMGKLLHEAGVLSKGHVVMCERATLIGQYYSSESENTIKALEEAQGGILFIDEAYQLHQPNDARDPGRFVIESLLTALADEKRNDWMLILAGYTGPMKKMFDLNPGLRSRIPDSNIYNFDDFSKDELMEIALRFFEANGFRLTAKAEEAMRKRIESDWASRTEDFGNARYVVNLIRTRVIPAMAMRLASVESPSGEELSLVLDTDIPKPERILIAPRLRPIGFAV